MEYFVIMHARECAMWNVTTGTQWKYNPVTRWYRYYLWLVGPTILWRGSYEENTTPIPHLFQAVITDVGCHNLATTFFLLFFCTGMVGLYVTIIVLVSAQFQSLSMLSFKACQFPNMPPPASTSEVYSIPIIIGQLHIGKLWGAVTKYKIAPQHTRLIMCMSYLFHLIHSCHNMWPTFEVQFLQDLQGSMFTSLVESMSNYQPGRCRILCQPILTVFLATLGNITKLLLYFTLLLQWDMKVGSHTTKSVQVSDSV